MEGTNINEGCNTVPEAFLKDIAKQILEGLVHLQLIHRANIGPDLIQ